jgi:hypothetical protein
VGAAVSVLSTVHPVALAEQTACCLAKLCADRLVFSG